MIDVTAAGMVTGVEHSACFFLILTRSIFTRPSCRLEFLTAIKAGKPFITLVETDERFGKFDFGAKTRDVPPCFWPIVHKICAEVSAFPLRRDKAECELMLDKVLAAYTKVLAAYTKGPLKVIRCTEQELVAAEAAVANPNVLKAAEAAIPHAPPADLKARVVEDLQRKLFVHRVPAAWPAACLAMFFDPQHQPKSFDEVKFGTSGTGSTHVHFADQAAADEAFAALGTDTSGLEQKTTESPNGAGKISIRKMALRASREDSQGTEGAVEWV